MRIHNFILITDKRNISKSITRGLSGVLVYSGSCSHTVREVSLQRGKASWPDLETRFAVTGI